MSSDRNIDAETWLRAEDAGCLQHRAERLAWLLSVTPSAEIWLFSGGWLGQHLFEEARYSYVYGQFLASAILGFAFVERSLASIFYRSGRNDLQRATSEALLKEAHLAGWLTEADLAAFEKARHLRNPLVHFRKPLDPALPETRSFNEEREPYEVVETDARHILEAAFRLIDLTSVK